MRERIEGKKREQPGAVPVESLVADESQRRPASRGGSLAAGAFDAVVHASPQVLPRLDPLSSALQPPAPVFSTAATQPLFFGS
jgi:hypothetical protein